MSRAEAGPRILEAAHALGAAAGVTALTLQGVATAAGVSKALVLYHFGGKDQLLTALTERLVETDARAMDAGAAAPDPLEAWRRVAGDATLRASRALLASLLREATLRPHAAAFTAARAAAATRLATAMLRAAELRPRIATPLLGQALLQQLDGVAVTHTAVDTESTDAALDTSALAILGLGR